MKSKKDLSMNDFYDFSSCNYLTTFYASTEKYCGIIHDDETRRKARAYIKGLFSGDYSNEDITFPVVYREDPYESGKKFRDILDNRCSDMYLKRLYNFPVKRYISEVICRILPITLIASLLYWIPFEVNSSLVKVLIVTGISIVINSILIITIGLNQSERKVIANKFHIINDKCKRN